MEALKYQEKKMSFNLSVIETNEEIIFCIDLYGYNLLFNDYSCAFFQYVCFVTVYLLLMKLIKDIINEDSDEYF